MCTFRGTTACYWGSTLRGSHLYLNQSLQDFVILQSQNLTQNQANSAIFRRSRNFSNLLQILGLDLPGLPCKDTTLFLTSSSRRRKEVMVLWCLLNNTNIFVVVFFGTLICLKHLFSLYMCILQS